MHTCTIFMYHEKIGCLKSLVHIYSGIPVCMVVKYLY